MNLIPAFPTALPVESCASVSWKTSSAIFLRIFFSSECYLTWYWKRRCFYRARGVLVYFPTWRWESNPHQRGSLRTREGFKNFRNDKWQIHRISHKNWKPSTSKRSDMSWYKIFRELLSLAKFTNRHLNPYLFVTLNIDIYGTKTIGFPNQQHFQVGTLGFDLLSDQEGPLLSTANVGAFVCVEWMSIQKWPTSIKVSGHPETPRNGSL